jgi:RNA polymerase sigma factor (sigma-70 family)
MGAMTDDPGDFETWYRTVHQRLGAALTVAFGDEDVAQESADEAVARAYAAWGSVSEMESPTGWLFTVAFNVARRRLRRRSFERRLHFRARDADARAPELELWLVVAELPARQRQAVVLRHVGQLREHEIAEAMGISRGGVSSTLRAAYRSLRTELSEPVPPQEER